MQKILILVGVILIVLGAVFSQWSVREAKRLDYHNVMVTKQNSTWIIDLENLKPDTRIKGTFSTTQYKPVSLTVVNLATKVGVPWKSPTVTNVGESTTLTDDGFFYAQILKTAPVFYEIKEEGVYNMIISLPTPMPPRADIEPYDSTEVVFFDFTVTFPSEFPYQIPGYGALATGSVLLVIGIIKRMRISQYNR